MIYIITAVCLAFLLGYILGKRQGIDIGFVRGKTEIPLELRLNSFELGRCVLCGAKARAEDNANIK